MGILDMPLISEMDEMEKKARQGNHEGLEAVYHTLRPMVRRAVDRFMAQENLSLRDAMKRAGVAVVCVR